MKKLFLLILFLILLYGCASEFDRDLEKGKSSLKSKNYEMAIENLENALIEEPNNEDAQVLLEKAKQEVAEIKQIELFEKYFADSRNVVGRFVKTKDPEFVKIDYSVDQYKEQYDLMKLIFKDANDIDMQYQNNKIIADMNATLIQSINDSLTSLQYLISLTEMIEDESKYNEAEFNKFGRLISLYTGNSNDDLFKYVGEVKDYRIDHKLISEK